MTIKARCEDLCKKIQSHVHTCMRVCFKQNDKQKAEKIIEEYHKKDITLGYSDGEDFGPKKILKLNIIVRHTKS